VVVAGVAGGWVLVVVLADFRPYHPILSPRVHTPLTLEQAGLVV
jgi:hypothetical protein